jgi:DNA-directed RNA polymerase subunit beta
MEESKYTVAQANAQTDEQGRFINDLVICRHQGDVAMFAREKVDLMDVSPKQLVSVAAALIPFLENDDANRALMGSNMQRQAVPLVRAEAPFVGHRHGAGRGAGFRRGHRGAADGRDRPGRRHPYRRAGHRGARFVALGRRHLPAAEVPALQPVDLHHAASAGQRRRPGAGRRDHRRRSVDGSRRPGARPERARRVHAVERLQLRGLILLSERIVRDDVFTSIHIEEFEVMARDTKLGPEEITRDIPNVSEEALKNLDEAGIVYVGARPSRATSWSARSRRRARAR